MTASWSKEHLAQESDWLHVADPPLARELLARMMPQGLQSLKDRLLRPLPGHPSAQFDFSSSRHGSSHFILQRRTKPGHPDPVENNPAFSTDTVISTFEGRFTFRDRRPCLAVLDNVLISPAYSGRGLGRKVIAGLFSDLRDWGCEEICVEAFGANGAYSWARLGMRPEQGSLSLFKSWVKTRFSRLEAQYGAEAIPPLSRKIYTQFMQSSDPRALWLLVDDRSTLKGEVFAKHLLRNMLNCGWEGRFRFDDIEAVQRLNAGLPPEWQIKPQKKPDPGPSDWFTL